MKNKVIIVIFGLLVIGGAVYFTTRYNAAPAKTGSLENDVKLVPTVTAATITYTDNGFSPATTTIKSGQAVKFVNNSSSEIQVDSDPHPAHTDDTDLNAGRIATGQSKTVTVTNKGTFGIHNHLDAGFKASITIQ